MKVEKLIVGQAYKYKELCELIGIEPTKKANNQRNAQFKELATRVDYEKKGHSIIIKEIYKVAKEKVDMRKLGNNNELSTHIQYSLLCLLENIEIKDKARGIGFNRYYLYNQFGMTNEKFLAGMMNKDYYAETIGMSKMAVYECYNYTYKNLYDTLDRAFDSLMRKRSGFTMTKGYTFVISEDGNQYFYTATREEESYISAVENEILVEMGIKDKYALFHNDGWREFKTKVITKLEDEYPLFFSGIQNYNNALVFSYTNKSIKLMKAKMEKDYGYNIKEVKANLNKLVSSSLDGVIDRRVGKEYSKEKEVIINYRKTEFYTDEQKIVKNGIIKVEQMEFDFNKLEENKNEEIPF